MGEDGRKKPTPRVNELRELTRSGRLPLGALLVHKGQRGGADSEATVVAEGLEVKGQVYASVSTAARASTGHAINGWVYWRLAITGERLNDLRRKS